MATKSQTNYTPLGYKGSVTLKILKGSKIIRTVNSHNEGSSELFRIMLSQLCGNDEDARLPRYLDVISVDATSGILNRIVLTGIKLDTVDGLPCAYFSALIPANQFKTNKTIIQFGLYNNFSTNLDTFLARVSLTDEQINSINNFTSSNTEIRKLYASYNLLIEWRMFISNADIMRLKTPVVTKSGTTVSWVGISNASSYNVVRIRNSEAVEVSQTATTYSDLQVGDSVQVQAVSDSTGYIESSWSNLITI